MTSPEPPYRFESSDGCSVICLLPELNEAQWADIEKVGTDLIERLNSSKSPAFLVDLTPLDYMGSATVALIVRLWKSVKERDGRMIIVNQHELVFEVMKLAGLHQIWTIVESRERAMRELGVSPTAGRGIVSGGGAGPAATGVALPALGIAAVAAAVVGLLLASGGMVGDRVALAMEFGFAAVGLVLGTMSWAQGVGLRRNLGIAVMIASLAVVVAGILMMPAGDGQRAAQAAPAPQADNAVAANAAGSDAATAESGAPADQGEDDDEE